ncbi:FkbM family methyltransferase [Candidatus Bathyarchaeota archaeon]|nr:FkbM family methyltransferase [Candidatus Bathyarchaeota archaeon]
MALYDLELTKQRVHYPYTPLEITVVKGASDIWRRIEERNSGIDRKKYIVELVREGDIILDIGAWIGDLTFLFSYLVGEKGQVHAFEPMPPSFSVLRKNTQMNHIYNIQLHNFAVSNVIDEVTLYSPASTSAQASMRKNPNNDENELYMYKCKCTTIDEFCKSHQIQPSGIKIDVQGEEGNVFKGAVNTIEKHHPWCLLEYHPSLLSESERDDIWTYINKKAKKVVYIDGGEAGLSYGDQCPQGFLPTSKAHLCIFF